MTTRDPRVTAGIAADVTVLALPIGNNSISRGGPGSGHASLGGLLRPCLLPRRRQSAWQAPPGPPRSDCVLQNFSTPSIPDSQRVAPDAASRADQARKPRGTERSIFNPTTDTDLRRRPPADLRRPLWATSRQPSLSRKPSRGITLFPVGFSRQAPSDTYRIKR